MLSAPRGGGGGGGRSNWVRRLREARAGGRTGGAARPARARGRGGGEGGGGGMSPQRAHAKVEATVPISSPEDKREYRRIVLPNGLTALLIHDPEMAAGGASGEDDDEEEDDEYSDEGSEGDDYGSDDGMEEGEEGEAGAPNGKGGGGGGATKKAAAALSVSVGSFSDPASANGLAHFLEHMLFMGSEDFPDENEYDSFLSKHGGGSNAFTECEHTCFFFDVHRASLRGALERFAGFFVSPLIKAGSMEREVQAVESEFRQALSHDGNRLLQLQCHTARDGHPFKAFFWGNMKSLRDAPASAGLDMRKQLLEFYDAHYCAPRMTLVVVGMETLDELQDMVGELFARVRPAPTPAAALPDDFKSQGMPFEPRMQYILPAVRDVMQLHVMWCLPPLLKAYRSKPADYASHLIGHEGRGSLFAALKARGWATALSGGVGDGGHDRSSNSSMFTVTAHLTEEGLRRRDDVASLIFQYAAMAAREGPQKWVFDELRAVAEVQFRYHEEEEADEYAVNLASNMPVYAPEHAVSGDYVFEDWDPQCVDAIMQHLTPANARIDLLAREDRLAEAVFGVPKPNGDVETMEVDGDGAEKAATAVPQLPEGALPSEEPWFGVKYSAAPVPAALLERWEAEAAAGGLHSESREAAAAYPALTMPPRNEFLPTNFELLPSPEVNTAKHPEHGYVPGVPPRTVSDGDLCRLWHKGDAVFRTPRACAFLSLSAPGHNADQRSIVMTELLAKLAADALNETTYMASMADLEAQVRRSGERLEVRVSGFSHNLVALLRTVLAVATSPPVKDDRFEVVREETARAYANANMRPMMHVSYLRLTCLRHATYDIDAVPALLEGLRPEDVRAYAESHFTKQSRVEALVTGNVGAAEVAALEAEMAQMLPRAGGKDAALRPMQRVTSLKEGVVTLVRCPCKNPKEENSALEVYWQVGPDDDNTRAALDLLEQAIGEPFFDTLRTKEQLGYSLDIGLRLTHGVLGFAARLQSAEHPPEHLSDCLHRFLAGYSETLRGMTDDEFEKYRSARISARLQKDASLLDESERQWAEVWEGRYLFDAREHEAAALARCKKEAVAQLFDTAIAPASTAQRKLWCAVYSRQFSERAGKDGEAGAAKAACNGALDAEHLPPGGIFDWRGERGHYDTPAARGYDFVASA
eukprot:PRCOL_00003896-RA